jgi:hypothetical protein
MQSLRTFLVTLIFGNWLSWFVVFLAFYSVFSTSLLMLRLVTDWTGALQVGLSLAVTLVSMIIILLMPSRINLSAVQFIGTLEIIPVWKIAVFGLALRLAWIFAFPAHPSSDGSIYLMLAETLKEGGTYQIANSRAYWPVGYPLFLAGWLSVFENHQVAYLFSNAVLYVVAIYGVAKLSHYLTGGKSESLAALLFAIWPNLILNTATPEKEMLVLALLPWATWALLKTISTPGFLLIFISGLLLGYATLVQPSLQFLPLVAGVLLFMVLGLNRSSSLKVLFLCLGAAIVIAPWTIRNYQQLDHFVLVSTNGGDNFYRANNPLADGGYTQKGEVDLSSLNEVDSNIQGKKLGIAWIVDHPVNFIVLAFEKQIRFMGDDAVGVYNTLKAGKASENTKIYILFKGLANLWWMAIWVVLALLVLFARRHHQNIPHFAFIPFWLWIYLFTLHSVFESGGKYHVPVLWVPCILIACYVSSFKQNQLDSLQTTG